MSLNFGPLDGGVYKCELNNATEENQAASTLHKKMDYIYLAIEVNSVLAERFLWQFYVYAGICAFH